LVIYISFIVTVNTKNMLLPYGPWGTGKTSCLRLHNNNINTNSGGSQGSYRSSIDKFPDFSSHGMTISLTLSKQ